MEWIQIALEEYKTLRTESLEAVRTQQTTVKLGIVIIGCIMVTGFNLWDKSLLSDIIFFIFIPLLCYITIVIWIGEVERMMRTRYFLTTLEKKISRAYPNSPKLLNYETWLSKNESTPKWPQLTCNYIAVIVLFFLMTLASIITGNLKLASEIDALYIILLNIPEILLLSAVIHYVWKVTKSFY